MIQETEKILSQSIDFFPLHSNAYIHEGNALRMDWETFEVLPESKNVIYANKTNIYKIDSDDTTVISEPTVKYGEVNIVTKEVEFKSIEELQTPKTISVTYDYIMGNPPFVGKKEQSKRQKEDMDLVFKEENNKGLGILDYVCSWYYKATKIIQIIVLLIINQMILLKKITQIKSTRKIKVLMK
jgi:type I restriction-modification system DNA methylase subunit